ncbi:MAG: neutral zinc metallopeptidase [Cyanobacteria bacterium J06638_20]
MRWQLGRRSQNVEVRRGSGFSRPAAGGGLGVIILALIVMLLGGDPTVLLDSGSPNYSPPVTTDVAVSEEQVDFVSAVLGTTEDVWGTLFQQQGGRYVEPRLVIFSGAVDSACGRAGASVGPFYCPADQQVYIDLSFYEDLQYRLGASGDFAQAYVIAHEVGHHVQNLLGISGQVQTLQRRVNRTQSNQLSVMLELQADCFAGVWAHNVQSYLEEGDVEEALNAAASIGDDRLQRQSQGYIVPESFTHGTSAQRMRWLKRGMQSGDVNQCNTFEAASL